jgi:hypothetical protein
MKSLQRLAGDLFYRKRARILEATLLVTEVTRDIPEAVRSVLGLE